MKSKLIPILSTALLLSGLSIASAIEAVDVNANADANIEVRTNGNATSTAAQTTVRGNATSTAAKSDARGNATSTQAKDNTRGNATSTNRNVDGNLTAESHRSAIASFVQSLLRVANREGGIGAQVRVVAQSQQDSASTSANAIVKVENRGGLRNFLLGTDYRSLGQLRSEMATTSANIARLKGLLANATDDVDKVELSTQIQVLENSQAKIETFIQAHEDSFSLFGWFTKRITK